MDDEYTHYTHAMHNCHFAALSVMEMEKASFKPGKTVLGQNLRYTKTEINDAAQSAPKLLPGDSPPADWRNGIREPYPL